MSDGSMTATPAAGELTRAAIAQVDPSDQLGDVLALPEHLRANPQIDLAVHNEGERTFLKLLESFTDREAWQSLPGVSFVKPDGSFVRNANIDRVRDLDEDQTECHAQRHLP